MIWHVTPNDVMKKTLKKLRTFGENSENILRNY